ncbi:MAG: TetR/AcrR family transcriptional regulator [Clostridia bacterium]|nr:TetR/AcrR family transcriptional regulator [Clostridia bacterium]
MNKNESKYFNTAIKMNKALIYLLGKKDFEYITIKEICSEAKVNRSTFYLHYENTRDLLEETSKYLIDNFLTYFDVDFKDVRDIYSNNDLSELCFITPEYLVPYLKYIKENQAVFKTALKIFEPTRAQRVYGNLFKYIFNPVLERFKVAPKEREYLIKFYLSGIMAVVMEWLSQGCKDDEEYLCDVINRCVFGGVDDPFKKK